MGLLEQAATDYSCTYKYNSNEFAGSGRKVVKRQQEAAKKWCAASSIWYHSGDRGIKPLGLSIRRSAELEEWTSRVPFSGLGI